MTGRYQQRFGHEANTPSFPSGLDLNEITMAQRLKSLGYRSAAIGKQPSDDPFFVYLSFTSPHGPLQATEEDLARFKHIVNERRRTYAAMVWAMDRAVGKVLSYLEATKPMDNTIV